MTYVFNRKLKEAEQRSTEKLKSLQFENNEKLQKLSQEHQEELTEANIKHQKELEELKDQLATNKSKEDAHRDYKYESITRLYREFQPALLQLIELSDSALRRIYRFADVAKEGKLEGWLSDSHNYFTITTVYRLIAPLAAYKILRSKLTLVDINVDTSISFQYTIAKTIYDTISDDIDLAKRLVKRILSLKYDPNIVGFGKRQGLFVGTVEKLIEDLIVQEANNISRVKSYGEFENEFFNSELNEWKQPWDKAARLYTTFHPKTSSCTVANSDNKHKQSCTNL
jgi:hypothetical protein